MVDDNKSGNSNEFEGTLEKVGKNLDNLMDYITSPVTDLILSTSMGREYVEKVRAEVAKFHKDDPNFKMPELKVNKKYEQFGKRFDDFVNSIDEGVANIIYSTDIYNDIGKVMKMKFESEINEKGGTDNAKVNKMNMDSQILYEAHKKFSENGISSSENHLLEKIDDVLEDASLQATKSGGYVITDNTGKTTEVSGRE